MARAVQLLTESPIRSKRLFLRNSGRKTATHFSWNCSNAPSTRRTISPPAPAWRKAPCERRARVGNR
ncbi:MAG: hypothetical protein E5W57_14335 [Mesorhizobium sp.]|nr:MAG: hypothetical protein E5W57_14335 [Mesorhizobium sp.]